MKKFFLFIIAVSSMHLNLMCMKRSYALIGHTVTTPKPDQTLFQLLTNQNFPTDVLNIVTSDAYKNKQWWYADQLILNPSHTAYDVFFCDKDETHGYALNPNNYWDSSKVVIFDKNNEKIIQHSNRSRIHAIKLHKSKKIALLYNGGTYTTLMVRHQKKSSHPILQNSHNLLSRSNLLQWSPDGRLIALQDDINQLTIGSRPYINKKIKTESYNAILSFVEIYIINKALFSHNNELIAYANSNKMVKIINLKTQCAFFRYDHPTSICTALAFNESSTRLSCAFADGSIETFNITMDAPFNQIPLASSYNNSNPAWRIFYNEQQELMGWYMTKNETCIEIVNTVTNIKTPIFYIHHILSPIRCLEFNNTCDRFGIGLKDGTIIFFKHYNPTPQQQVLRHILHLWLCCQKPSKAITSADLLCKAISNMFKLNQKELNTTWNSLPEYMKTAVEENMNRLIQKYGK